ncbi:hypothetical protein [Ferruginibacter sp.]
MKKKSKISGRKITTVVEEIIKNAPWKKEFRLKRKQFWYPNLRRNLVLDIFCSKIMS